MPHPFQTFSQSDYLIQIVDINSHNEWQTVQIQISWLLRSKLIWIYTVCKGRVYPGSAGQGLSTMLLYLAFLFIALCLPNCICSFVIIFFINELSTRIFNKNNDILVMMRAYYQISTAVCFSISVLICSMQGIVFSERDLWLHVNTWARLFKASLA